MKTTFTLIATVVALFGFAGNASAHEHCQKGAKAGCCAKEKAKAAKSDCCKKATKSMACCKKATKSMACCKKTAKKAGCCATAHTKSHASRSRAAFGYNGLGYPVRSIVASKGCCKHMGQVHAQPVMHATACSHAATVKPSAPAPQKAAAHCCAM
jgi:hypothetical protein